MNGKERIEAMAQATPLKKMLQVFLVFPTWTIVLFTKNIGDKQERKTFPRFGLILNYSFMGAVSFTPYRHLFEDIIKSPRMNYVETYNASEGFFGIQDQSDSDEMLLMLDYGIFYEFIPIEESDKEQPKTLLLDQVELDQVYEVVISTNAGLWRYRIGRHYPIYFAKSFPHQN